MMKLFVSVMHARRAGCKAKERAMKYLELARLAGVSVSTVSKVLSGSSEISRETAERVMRVAAEHGVLLTKGRSVKIDPDELRAAVLVPELTSIY